MVGNDINRGSGSAELLNPSSFMYVAVRTWSAGGGASPSAAPLKLMVLDEIQVAYSKPEQIAALTEYMKNIASGQQQQGTSVGVARIVLAGVHGDSPSMGSSSAGRSGSKTPFTFGQEHLVGLLSTSAVGPLEDDQFQQKAVAAAAAAVGSDQEAKDHHLEYMKNHAPSVAFTAVEAELYWQKFWKDEEMRAKLFTMTSPSVQEHLLWVTAGQVSICTWIGWCCCDK